MPMFITMTKLAHLGFLSAIFHYILLWKQRKIYWNIFTISHLNFFWILIFHDINSLLLFYKSYDKWFPKAEEIRKITSGKVKPFLLKAKREREQEWYENVCLTSTHTLREEDCGKEFWVFCKKLSKLKYIKSIWLFFLQWSWKLIFIWYKKNISIPNVMSNIINSLYASPGSISEGDDERKLKSYVIIP